MRPAGRRQPKESFNPPPSPMDFQLRHFPGSSARDSDASFASSRPSSVGAGGRPTTFDLYKERSFQQMAVSTINAYLSSQSFPIFFKASVPSAKDIHETLKFLLSRIDFQTSKLEEDLPVLLKRLGYPFKLNKSILKSPAAPHQWPTFLALIHWLVQIAKYNDHLSSSSNTLSFVESNLLHQYTLDSYMHYIRGDDDAVDELDREIKEKLEQQMELAEEKKKAVQENVKNSEAELMRLKSMPSQKEMLDREKEVLENDVKKFHMMIEGITLKTDQVKKVLAEKEKQLEAKVVENSKICEENQELKRRVDLQIFNARDVEKMRRELQAVERDTEEAELARNAWEEKSWDLDASLGHNFKDLEALALECNQALRRLKIGNDILYQLNAKGTTPAEIMGIDHKLSVKPALNSFADDLKKSHMEKLDELISHQQKSSEVAARLERKRNHIAAVWSRIEEMDSQLNKSKKETQDYANRCSIEAKKMLDDVQLAAHDLDNVEREVAEVLKASEMKLQEAIKQSEEEIQMHAQELFKLVDSVSKYKEHVASKISEMKRDLSETATAVSVAYRGSLPAHFCHISGATHEVGKID